MYGLTITFALSFLYLKNSFSQKKAGKTKNQQKYN
jgi:hypothetical protein